MNYNEKVKELNTLLRILDSTIITISIGIFAYSFTDLSNNHNYEYIYLIFIAWGFLTIAFFTGFIRLIHLISVMGRNAVEQFNYEVNKKPKIIDESRIRQTNRKSAWLYRIMLNSFFFGIILFGVFKIINLN